MVDPRFKELRDKRKKWVDVTRENKFKIDEILSGLYDDPSHLVYEILQNAEDVDANTVKFTLFEDRLEIWHDGEDFEFKNVDAITGIGKTTKKDDLNAIGKFGVGFKSVYAVTKSPTIYSNIPNWSNTFKIEDLVVPIPLKEDYSGEGTRIVLPFDHPKRTPKKIFAIIGDRLKEMGLETLLFLRKIKKIEFCIGNFSGAYAKEIDCNDEDNHFKRVTLSYETNNNSTKEEKWLIFDRHLPSDEDDLKVEIAFKTGKNDKDEETILPVKLAKLSAFFLTNIGTGLRFIIQGPYRTTPARDNVPLGEDWNRKLIEETATLAADIIPVMRDRGYLNVDFLNSLPLNKEQFEDEPFQPIFDKIKEKLSSEEELLPADDRSFISTNNALLAGVAELRDLLKKDQLLLLFNKTKWLDGEITERKTPLLRDYLIKELKIPEIDPDRFARVIDEAFLKAQADEWFIDFYKFIHGRGELWRAGNHWRPEGLLRSKPIIRLDDGRQAVPFGKPQPYLSPTDEKIRKNIRGLFPTVRNVIATHPEANKFLKELGLDEPDAVAGVLEHILPKYRPLNKKWKADDEEQETTQVDLKENLRDVDWIIKAIQKSPEKQRKEELLPNIKETEFLYARNMSDSQKYYCSSEDSIYLGKTYTGDEEIEVFFEGNDEIWLLDEGYKDILDLDTLKLLGCNLEISVSYRKPGGNNMVVIRSSWGDHARGLSGFDPDCEIEGLERALETINPEKSQIIWDVLKRHYRLISGEVETSSQQDYGHPERKKRYSKMGKLLVENPWLYKEGDNTTPQLPSEILLEDLSSEYKCPEAQMIADQLEFITPVTKELKEKMDPADRKLFEDFEEAKRLGIADKVRELIRKEKESEKMRGEEETLPDIVNDFEEGLTPDELPRENGTMDGGWDGVTPEEIEEVAENYEVVLEGNIEDAELITEQYIGQRSKIGSRGNGKKIEPREFLRDKYNGGHCQICNTLIDLGNGKKHFVSKRIKPKEHQRKWTDEVWNLLCLCPNCYALVL